MSNNKVTSIAEAKKEVSPDIPYRNVMAMLDAFSHHYGLGLQGQWGKYSGCESIAYTLYGGSDKVEPLSADEFIDALKEGIMIYETKGPEDPPPPQLNAALHDMVKKLETFKAQAAEIT